MALDDADRMTIESITGPVDPDHHGAAERAIVVYGTGFDATDLDVREDEHVLRGWDSIAIAPYKVRA